MNKDRVYRHVMRTINLPSDGDTMNTDDPVLDEVIIMKREYRELGSFSSTSQGYFLICESLNDLVRAATDGSREKRDRTRGAA
jgi:hypothetical protein